MLRGAIEIAQTKRVAGWIVSSTGPLRGKMILAFSGPRCVGAGSVSVFRPDLIGPDIGDGFSGFDFEIELHEEEAIGSVVVRLELCDAALIQDGSEVVARRSKLAALPTPMHRQGAQERRPAVPSSRRA